MRLTILLFTWILALPVAAYSASEPLSLTLRESIRMAVEKNLDVRAELYNPAQFEADINRNRAIYEPVLDLKTSYIDSTVSSIGQNGTFSSSQSFALDSSISSLFWTGGTASLFYNNDYTGSNPTIWQTSLGASISQPLLKNSGRESTELAINVSRLSKFASLERFNTRLLGTVAQVRNEYYKLYSLREDLEVKKVSLALASKILSDTQARVKAGVLPAMEILNAEYGNATREKDLIDAELAVSNQLDVLRLLLQIENKNTDLLTVDMPPRELYEVVEEDSIRKAFDRPDVREQKRNLEMSELQTRVYSSRTRPDLALIASASLTGRDSAYQRNLDKVVTFDYPFWSIGLNFTYPLGNGAAENDYRRSRLKTEQVALQIRSLEEKIINDVKAAIRGISTWFKQIEVADRGRAFAEERLRAYIRKNEVGLATTKDLFDVENDLAIAKSNQINAVVGYANSLTRYWQVTGELLEREGVRVVESDADKLYSATR